MAIIIFYCPTQPDSKLLLLQSFIDEKDVLVSSDDFQTTRFKIHSSISKINILNYNFVKSERYELYLISKRYGVPFCIISEHLDDREAPKPTNRYDNPYCDIHSISKEWISNILAKHIKKSGAHKKLELNENYISKVKGTIDAINRKYGNKFYFGDLEILMMQLLESNPKPINEIRISYEAIIINEMEKRKDTNEKMM